MRQKAGLKPLGSKSDEPPPVPPTGNINLRMMSPMKARALCRGSLIRDRDNGGDGMAWERYKQWAGDYEEGLRLVQRVGFEKNRQR